MTDAYLNMSLITKLSVAVAGQVVALPVKDHADGLIGVLPVFDSEEAARAYSDREIMLLTVDDKAEL